MSGAVSHRVTTSSRRPGVQIRGSVRWTVEPLQLCPKCGTLRHGSGPHAPHYDGHHQVVDCSGAVIG